MNSYYIEPSLPFLTQLRIDCPRSLAFLPFIPVFSPQRIWNLRNHPIRCRNLESPFCLASHRHTDYSPITFLEGIILKDMLIAPSFLALVLLSFTVGKAYAFLLLSISLCSSPSYLRSILLTTSWVVDSELKPDRDLGKRQNWYRSLPSVRRG